MAVTIRQLMLVTVICLLCTPLATARMRELGPSEALAHSDLVAAVVLSETVEPGQTAELRVLKTVTGDSPAGSIRMMYPKPYFEEMWAHVPPRKGTVLLVFLKKRPDGTFVAATAVGRGRSLVDGKEVEKESFFPAGGNQCLKLIKDEAEVDRVAELFSQFLRWDSLDGEQRAKLLKASLTGPEVMRSIALGWLTIDRKIDFEKRAEVSDDLVEGVLANLHSSNPQIRQLTRVAMNLAVWSRKDLVPYFIDALDDPEARLWAVSRLDWVWSPGSTVDPKQSLEERAAMWKNWWSRSGSKQPQCRRFIPRPTSPPQPASRSAGTSTLIELPATRPATQPAAQRAVDAAPDSK